MRPTKSDLANINLDRLPPQLRMLARVLGEAEAFRLVEQLGGTPIIVPKRFDAEHVLLHVLGLQSFLLLIEAFGEETLQLPKFDSVLRQVRHRRVNELLDQGYLQREVALQTNYTVRQVINIKNAASVDDGQLGFWDDAEEVADAEPSGLAHDPFNLSVRKQSAKG